MSYFQLGTKTYMEVLNMSLPHWTLLLLFMQAGLTDVLLLDDVEIYKLTQDMAISNSHPDKHLM